MVLTIEGLKGIKSFTLKVSIKTLYMYITSKGMTV